MSSKYRMSRVQILVSAGYRVELVTVDPRSAVTGSHGMTLAPTGVLGQPDLLVVTGGGWSTRAADSAWGEVQRGVDVRLEARVVDDGDVLTSGGVTSGIDLALHLIEVDRGRGPVLMTDV